VKKLIVCQCGETIRGKDDDDLYAKAMEHAQKVHGGMQISREQVLAMAQPDNS
jgi:predicted small metal-binding protein